MPQMTFDPAIERVADAALLGRASIRKGQAFGMPGYYVGSKLAAGVWEDGLTLKLPAAMAQDLLLQGLAAPFAPMPGRAMREWVLVRPVTPEVLRDRADWIDAAIDYVGSGAAAPARRPATKSTKPAKRAAPRPATQTKPSSGKATAKPKRTGPAAGKKRKPAPKRRTAARPPTRRRN